MKKTLLKIIALTLAFSSLLTIPVSAVATSGTNGASSSGSTSSNICNSSANEDVKRAAGCNGNENSIVTIIQVILNSVIAVVGIVAVIFVVMGGVNFMTSQGDPGKVAKARQTILYACIGLIVCALSFAIVNWTIGIINGANSNKKETTNSQDSKDNKNSKDSKDDKKDDSDAKE